jgi:glutathione S-transferase
VGRDLLRSVYSCCVLIGVGDVACNLPKQLAIRSKTLHARTHTHVLSRTCRDVYAGLDKMEAILSKQRYLAGDKLTEADIRAFVTLIRCAACCGDPCRPCVRLCAYAEA